MVAILDFLFSSGPLEPDAVTEIFLSNFQMSIVQLFEEPQS